MMQYCEICGGSMWDNRDTKRSARSPDYRCKDPNCKGAIWLEPKGGGGGGEPGPRRRSSADSQPVPPKRRPRTEFRGWGEMVSTYTACKRLAEMTWGKDTPAEVLHAACYSLFREAIENGLGAYPIKREGRTDRPGPMSRPVPLTTAGNADVYREPPKQAKEEPDFSDFPAALEPDEQDDLPF